MQTAEIMPLVVELICGTQNVLESSKPAFELPCYVIMTSQPGDKGRAPSSKFATAALFE